MAEALLPLRVANHLRPFALVGVHEVLRLALELLRDAEMIVDDDLAQVLDPARKRVEPARRARQAIGGADVIEQEAVDEAE